MQPAKLLNMVIFYLITGYIFLRLKKDYKINALQMDSCKNQIMLREKHA